MEVDANVIAFEVGGSVINVVDADTVTYDVATVVDIDFCVAF